jgi:uncharacterized protein HemX
MKPQRPKTAIRMKAVRERLDAFEAQETAGSAPAAPNKKVALVFWLCVIAVGIGIYFFAAWYQRT